MIVEPLLRLRKPLPARQVCRQIYFAPRRVARRFLKIGKMREEVIDEIGDALLAIRALRPVIRDHDCPVGNGIDVLTVGDDARIILAG